MEMLVWSVSDRGGLTHCSRNMVYSCRNKAAANQYFPPFFKERVVQIHPVGKQGVRHFLDFGQKSSFFFLKKTQEHVCAFQKPHVFNVLGILAVLRKSIFLIYQVVFSIMHTFIYVVFCLPWSAKYVPSTPQFVLNRSCRIYALFRMTRNYQKIFLAKARTNILKTLSLYLNRFFICNLKLKM